MEYLLPWLYVISKNFTINSTPKRNISECVAVLCPNFILIHFANGYAAFPIRDLVWSISGNIAATTVMAMYSGRSNMFTSWKLANSPVNVRPPAM